MDLLLDTNALLWWLDNSARLGEQARVAIESPLNSVYVSAVTAWEIAIKIRIGKLRLPQDPEVWLPEQVVANRLTPLAISIEHALTAGSLPGHHQDPFDRLLVAQASIDGMTVVSGDRIFERYGIPLLVA